MTVKVAELIKELSVEETRPAMYFLMGRLYPIYVAIEFNFSRKLIFRALSTAINDEKKIQEIFAKTGDAGKVAEEIITNYELRITNDSKKREIINLSLVDVYKKLEEIAVLSGKGSQEGKMKLYLELISTLNAQSVKYATKIIVGELRLGVSDKTLLDSLSWYKVGDKSLRKTLDFAFGSKADIGELAELVKTSKNIEEDLKKIKLEPGIPIASKLVEREKDSEKVWERMPECFVQPKLDGLRGQIHFSKKKLAASSSQPEAHPYAAIYSRNMENMTDQFPELLEAVKELGVDSIILDSEIVGFDVLKNKYFSYQETMQRKRKYDIELFSQSFPVRAMCFDVLYLNGKDLTNEPIEKRLEILNEILNNNKNSNNQTASPLHMLETRQMKSLEELTEFFETTIGMGLEGIITKEKESTYEPGTRNFKWIKLKANSKSELVDTIDVVVLGYYVGRGQRAKFGMGALLTGVYDAEKDTYYSIGKVGSGIKETDFEIIKKDLEKIKIEEKPENVVVDKTLTPDVWVRPQIVMEIDADEITRSPNHTAARGIKSKVSGDKFEDKGLSIRFPRMKIWNRDKKYPNTVSEIIRLYELRKDK